MTRPKVAPATAMTHALEGLLRLSSLNRNSPCLELLRLTLVRQLLRPHKRPFNVGCYMPQFQLDSHGHLPLRLVRLPRDLVDDVEHVGRRAGASGG